MPIGLLYSVTGSQMEPQSLYRAPYALVRVVHYIGNRVPFCVTSIINCPWFSPVCMGLFTVETIESQGRDITGNLLENVFPDIYFINCYTQCVYSTISCLVLLVMNNTGTTTVPSLLSTVSVFTKTTGCHWDCGRSRVFLK